MQEIDMLEVAEPKMSGQPIGAQNDGISVDDANISKSENPLGSSLVFQVLRDHLDLMAEMLDCKPDELYILNEIHCRDHMTTSYRDPLLDQRGLKGMPYVHSSEGSRKHAPLYWVGTGFHLYETVPDELLPNPVRYLVATIPTNRGGDDKFYIVPHGKLSRLVHYFKRVRLKSLKTIVPILHEGILDDVMKNTVNFLKSSNKFRDYGASAKRGVIFSGSPGNGKTLTCRYIRERAASHGIDVFEVNQGELEDALVRGSLEWLLNRDGITFLDDIDISYFNRSAAGGSKMACALLSAMDGMENDGHCVRIFTTNEVIKDMDDAFKRPGRIDKVFSFEKPNMEMRRKLFGTWPSDMIETIDPVHFLESTEGFSFAECEAIRNIMVTNFIVEEQPWDFDAAVQEYHERTGESFNRTRVGFTG
jgi:cell division protease FtsH